MLTASLLSGGAKLSEEQSKFIYEELILGVARRAVEVKTTKDSYANLVADTLNSLVSLFSAEL